MEYILFMFLFINSRNIYLQSSHKSGHVWQYVSYKQQIFNMYNITSADDYNAENLQTSVYTMPMHWFDFLVEE